MSELDDQLRMSNEGDFSYPEAGINASPAVQSVIAEFRSLPASERAKTPLLYYVLGSGTPEYKMSKKGSDYKHHPVDGQTCGNCQFAYQRVSNGEYICSQIRGNVKLNHWCRLWRLADEIKKKTA